jgi:hypothetical protein
VKVALRFAEGSEHEALLCVQWTVWSNPLQARSEKLLLETVPGKIQGRRRAHSFPDQGVDGISCSKGLTSRQRTPGVNPIMGKVLKFRCNDVFFPEVTVSMGAAYDAAIATLPPDARSVFYFRERVAKRIMRAAYAGEIDREQLRQSGLFGFRKLTKGGKVLVAPVRAAIPENAL